MSDIAIAHSPLGIRTLLAYSDQPQKMDIVDITNAIATELGQPMHAFDADKIDGNITVRLAKDGEKLLALNGIEYTLTSEDIVIADASKPLALAGII